MTAQNRELTNSQETFVELLAAGVGRDLAAAGAGYGQCAAYSMLNTPAVTQAIARRMRATLQNDAAPLAIKVLMQLTRDETVHAAIRRSAARDLLDRAGYVPPKAADADVSDKSIAAMPADELAALVNKLEGELASRAKDVSAPNAPAIDDELAEMLS